MKYMRVSTFTGSVTEIVTPHIGWDVNGHWIVDVGTGTNIARKGSSDLMKSSCKSPNVFPGITSMYEANVRRRLP